MHTDPFLAQLADLCRREPVRAKWVFVPAHAVGFTLGDRLAREGSNWANLRFVTPLDIAVRMGAPFLLERGIDPSGESLGPALVMRLLLDLPASGGYFRPMAGHTSMAAALWQTIRELRHAGIRAADLAATPFTANAVKQSETVALVSAYEHHLEVQRVADVPMLLEEAMSHAAWCPIGPDDPVTELPDVTWSPLVRRFLDTLPGRRVRPRAPILAGGVAPSRVPELGPAVERVETPTPTGASRLRFLQSPAEAGPADGDTTIELFHAGGRDAEIEEVFRRILDAGFPLDQVEIACASNSCQPLVREKALRRGWKVTLSAGVPAAMTRPGRLLLQFCDWVGHGLAAADLRRLLQSGDCRPAIDRGGAASDAAHGETSARVAAGALDAVMPGEGEPGGESDQMAMLSPGQAARLLLKAQATAGRGTYPLALTRLAAKYDRAAALADASGEDRGWHRRKAQQARALLAWIERALSAVPDPAQEADGRIPLLALVDAAGTFLEANAARASALDAVAQVALVEALADLRALADYRCTLEAGLTFLRERVESLAVGRERPRPGHLHVSSLARAGYDGRRFVFVVGLEEGGVFPASVEDPVLLDVERRAISGRLRTSVDRQDEAVLAALSRLAVIGLSAGRVCLSFSCFDTREFRQTFPSWIVLQALRLKERDPHLGYDDLARTLGEPASAVSPAAGRAATETGWWLTQARRAGASGVARTAILETCPWLVQGIRAEEQRASDRFTAFDGHVASASLLLDPTCTRRPVSATTLEKAAKCPLRFFMEQGLGVRPIEEGRADEEGWLDPLTKGSELHALFARIVRAIRDEKRAPNLKKDRARLAAWGRERLDELREEIPPPSEEVFRRESREFLEDLDAFIEAECEGRHGTEPVAIEVPFGFPLGDGELEKLASADPVAVDLGRDRVLLVHGRIDRINRVAKGQYEVIDYKTGGYWPDDWQGEFAGGTRLQHALYGVAAESLLRPHDRAARVVRGAYVFPAVKGYRRRKVIPSPSRAKLAAVLNDLVDLIRNGAFVPADGEQACKWCEFEPACHSTEVSRAAAKRENAANTVLEPFRRLRGNHA